MQNPLGTVPGGNGSQYSMSFYFKVCLKSFAVHLVRQPADVEGILNLRKLDIIVFHRRMSRFTGYLDRSCSAALAVPNLLCNVSVSIIRGRREGGEGGREFSRQKISLVR